MLKALLPESGTDIKGHMRSYRDLLEASGYGSRANEFDDLLRILDGELRLITPTDPEGWTKGEENQQRNRERYLPTDARLPRAVVAGMADPQAEGDPPRTGGASSGGTLVLVERQTREPPPPSALEWANIRLLTRKKDWTEPQRRMMRKAGGVHGIRTRRPGSAGLGPGAASRAMAHCRHRVWWNHSGPPA